jgi:hypothetical protein
MLPIDITQNSHSGLNVLSRANYMMTPCHHLFHTECLERVLKKNRHFFLSVFANKSYNV